MFAEIKEELKPRKFLSIAIVGIVIGALQLPSALSLGALMYSGDLAVYAAAGMGFGILGAVVTHFILAFIGSSGGVVGGIQDAPAAILGAAMTTTVAAMVAASSDAKFATALAMVMLTTFLTGALFIAVGWFNLSRFVRFIPYPVIGGFIAGTGLLVTIGGISVMTDLKLSFDNLPLLFTTGMLARWIPGIVLAVTLMIVTRRIKHFLVMPAMLILSVLVFHLIIFLLGFPVEQARAEGWLLGPFPEGSLWMPIDFSMFALADWGEIVLHINNMLAASAIGAMALLLNVSALELIIQKDMDARWELISMGAVNIAASLTGSSPIYHYMGLSAMAAQNKTTSRLVNIVAGLLLIVVMIFGSQMLGLVPKLMVGGLLFSVGVSFLIEWVIDSWKKLPRLDYFLVVAILLVVGWFGFLQGVGVGILGAIALFAVNYSRQDVVKDTFNGATFRSNVERPIEHYEILQKRGDQLWILRLQGYLFFGTSQGLLERIRERIQNRELVKLDYLLIDFSRVTELDTSAVVGFVRIRQLAMENKIHLVFADISQSIRIKLSQGGLTEDDKDNLRIFQNLDHGAEWCESRIIMGDATSTMIRIATFKGQMKRIFPGELTDRFMTYLAREEMDEYHVLISQSDLPDRMYFIESGKFAAYYETSQGKFIRLRTMGAGAVIGEIGMYLKLRRTATVTAITNKCVIYCLTRESIKEMEKNDPELALRLHEWMASLLSQKLAGVNRTLEIMYS